MKKGLISVLGTVLLAIAGNGFANAPIIEGVPDVVIGDAEENVGQTIDQNFFQSLSAFNIMSYVKDADATSTPDVLKFAFDELGTGDPAAGGDINNISINGKLQVSSSDPATWGANAFQVSGAYLFSFRDILRSPAAGTPPFANPTLADGSTPAGDGDLLPWNTASGTLGGDSRQVTIFVADETDNVDQDTINVYSQNGVEDSLSGTFTTVFSDSTFADADWDFQTFPTANTPATSAGGTGTGFISMTAGATAATGGAIFGRWNQIGTNYLGYDYAIDAVDSTLIYKAKLDLQLTSALDSKKSQAPDIRFGVENPLQMLVTMNSVASEAFANAEDEAIQTHLPLVGQTNSYGMYWAPGTDLPQAASLQDFAGPQGALDLDGWHVFFDVLDFNAQRSGVVNSGEWRMTGLTVYTLPRPETDPSATPVTDFSAAGGWSAEVPNVGGITTTGTAGSVVFAGPANATGTLAYALWGKSDIATWEAGNVLRVTAKLSTPTNAARQNLHAIRLRTASAAGFIAQEFQILRRSDVAGVEEALMPAVATQTTYETYVPMYGGPHALVTAANLDGYNFALDDLGGAAAAASSWTCHSVMFEVLADPLP